MEYKYKVDLIPDLPQEGYRNGVGKWEGVCIHETSCANDSDESEVAYFKKNWRTRRAFAHVFIDEDSMTQAAKWEYKSWAQGNGNNRYISIEMCYSGSQKDFDIIYSKTCQLAASKLFERKLGVIDGKTLVSHDWVRQNLGGTTHTDPIAYLKRWGKTWSDMVNDVKKEYDKLQKPIPNPKPQPSRYCDIYVNEKFLTKDGYLEDGRTYVPVRVIGQALGKEIGFENKKATIEGKVIGSTMLHNGVSYAWSAEIAKATGAKLEWDNKTKTLYYHV